MRVVLISTYDLGRQPLGLASPAAVLREAGAEVVCADLSRSPLPEEAARAAGVVAFFLPMHTATRLALPVIDRVRALNPGARLCAYGLYAPLNEVLLREHGVQAILGPECEEDLLGLATSSNPIEPNRTHSNLPRVRFRVPDRAGLPSLDRYARLQMADGTSRVVGYTEGSRGCKHLCRHCPIVPVYAGRFRAVPVDVVLADIRAQVAAGAQHITLGDPDFFNGVTHALRIVRALAREWPALSYDVTIKIEHLVRHAGVLPELAATGCAFITSAVESIDDAVLEKLAKGHTRADFERAVALCRDAGVPLAPTFVAFNPWSTLEGYVELLDTIDRLDLAEHVAPIQLAIRLLITRGSPLLELPDVRAVAGPFNSRTLTHPWRHPDPEVDRLQYRVETLVGLRVNSARQEVFDAVRRLAGSATAEGFPRRSRGPTPALRQAQGVLSLSKHARSRSPFVEAQGDPELVEGSTAARLARAAGAMLNADRVARAAIPYLTEPWYC